MVWYAVMLIMIINVSLKTPVSYLSIYIYISLIGVIFTCQILHMKQYFMFSRIMYLLCILATVFLFSNIFSPGDLTEFYLLFIPAISLLYFDNKYVNITVLIVSLLFFALPNLYFNNYTTLRLHSPGMICLFLIFYMLVSYFKKVNDTNEKLLALERDKVLSDKIILEKQEVKLRELNQFKSHFFVNLSHEIRTPITLIKGYASKINFDEPKEQNEQKLTIVNDQITQIEDILNSILDLSKLDENKLNLHFSKVAIVPFIKNHFTSFKSLFKEKNIVFNLNSSIDNMIVKLDTNLFSKAFNNLLNNALKFTRENGKVSINVYKEADITIEIIDNGIGIPKEDLDKVFDRFYQSDNDITKTQGSGIGLSFTKGIIETHGFSMQVKSIPNIKTVFTISIPQKYISIQDTYQKIMSPSIIEQQTTVEINKETAACNVSKNETILIVDDHKELRNYVKSVLKSYHILEAENGKKALEIIQKTTIDLIVTDYMMPEINGKELTVEIKKRGLKTPIIMLTARVDDFAKLDMLRIGVDNYLIKPFIEEELLLSIKNSLQLYKNIQNYSKELSSKERKEFNKIDLTFSKDIKKIIEKNISNPDFRIEDIAQCFNISKRTLNRRAQNILGQTVKELIIKIRLEKARELQLKKSNLSRKEIATIVGGA